MRGMALGKLYYLLKLLKKQYDNIIILILQMRQKVIHFLPKILIHFRAHVYSSALWLLNLNICWLQT